MPNDFTEQLIKEFRANAGQVGGHFDGARLLLLTTSGVRSRLPHLHYHHTGESAGVFPALEVRHPELADTIAVLRSEHDQIAVLLEELEKLVAGPAPDLLGQVDQLIGELTAHLDREEAELLPYL